MRRSASLFAAALLAAALPGVAAPALFPTATQSNWSVTKGGKPLGTITLLTSPQATRAEFRGEGKSTAATVFLGGQNKVWLRVTGGDAELESMSVTNVENTTAPALLLPFTISPSMKVDVKDGKASSYAYRGATATYKYDAKGPSTVDIASPDGKYTLTRTSLSASKAAADSFTIRPKKSAGSRLARLSGDRLGSSDTSVSATAGGRGVGHEGMKLADGGDYAAVQKLEKRDAAWRAKLDAALAEFQKDGKVGKERENQ
ncbi:MAG: hypothetical protein JWO56_526 [Acidobacteria bacterium]|nr:hypothetical protein [Acidobacteriota bacterium]